LLNSLGVVTFKFMVSGMLGTNGFFLEHHAAHRFHYRSISVNTTNHHNVDGKCSLIITRKREVGHGGSPWGASTFGG
jgi:hypothetical protein